MHLLKQNKIISILLFYSAILLILITCENSTNKNDHNPDLIWSDEFNGSSLDESKWNYDIGYGPNNWGWGNDEWQYYSDNRKNIRVENGYLTITVRCPDGVPGKRNGTITSARINTKNKFSHKYGRIQARIKAPYSTGMWSAFWLLGKNIDHASWPGCGEIDIFEMFINHSNNIYNNKTTHSTIHWLNHAGQWNSYGDFKMMDDFLASDFHIYEIVWNEQSITGKIDGHEYFYKEITAADMSEFHQEFYMLFNLAVGGIPVSPPDGTSEFPQTMKVDWVRWYRNSE